MNISIGTEFWECRNSECIDSREGLGFNLCVAPIANIHVLNFWNGRHSGNCRNVKGVLGVT